jgi:uncharacterized protein YjdB
VYVASNDPSAYSSYVLRGVRGATISVNNVTPVVPVGGGVTLTATAYSGSTPVPGVTFTWSSSNPAIVTVNASGRLTGVAVGTATVTVSAVGGVSRTVTVQVVD